MTKALIIGGGVAGPVVAMALRRAGIECVVFEAYAPADVGSYLTVATNGLSALRVLDAHEAVMAAGFPTSHAVLSSGSGKRLARVPIGGTRPSDTASVTIKRARLHRALHEQARARGVPFEFGRRLVEAVTTPQGGVIGRFEDGTEACGDLLVGCDGVHSVTRRIIDRNAPGGHYVGLLNFGGITRDLAVPVEPGAWHMVFGKRAFFGHVADGDGGIVWFVNVPHRAIDVAERQSTTPEQWKQFLIDLFAGDRGPAARIIEAGTLELAADNTYDLPRVPTWHRDSMIVIGDAAHAPSPSSGQGASLAIEDAVVLAKCLRDASSIPCAFAGYERLRRRRVESIVAAGARQSHNKTLGPIGMRLRDLVLPFVFKYVITEKSLSRVFDYPIDWDQRMVPESAKSV